jgi:hypothetical protein
MQDGVDQQDDRRYETGDRDHRQPEPPLLRGITGPPEWMRHTRMQRGGRHQYVVQEERDIDRVADHVQPVQDQRVIHEVGDQRRGDGSADELVHRPAGRAGQQRAHNDEQDREVHDRVGKGDEPAERVGGGVVGVGPHQELPADGQCSD